MDFTFDDYKSFEKTEQFHHFIDTLSITNRTPNYYVNWNKVYNNVSEIELSLHTLNYLLGKSNIYDEAINLFKKQPGLIKVIPILLAIREKSFPVLILDENLNMEFLNLDFKNVDYNNIESYVEFTQKAGLLDFLSSKLTNNLVDYIFGVEVGLDSNGRKNRSGAIMEEIIEKEIQRICSINNLEYTTQANPNAIMEKWNYTLPSDEAKRRHDFAVYNPRKNELSILEVNYYGGGGSKLNSVAGEFISLNSFLHQKDSTIKFIWITDGQGWLTAKNPLMESFINIEHIFNLRMINSRFLEYVLVE